MSFTLVKILKKNLEINLQKPSCYCPDAERNGCPDGANCAQERFIKLSGGVTLDLKIKALWPDLFGSTYKSKKYNSGTPLEDVKKQRKLKDGWDIPTKSELKSLTRLDNVKFKLSLGKPNVFKGYNILIKKELK